MKDETGFMTYVLREQILAGDFVAKTLSYNSIIYFGVFSSFCLEYIYKNIEKEESDRILGSYRDSFS